MESIARYWRQIWLVLMTLALGLILASGQDTNWSISASKPISDSKCSKIKIWQIAQLKWNSILKLENQEKGPPPSNSAVGYGGRGPKYYPERPDLVTSASPGGLASKVFQGTAESLPVGLLWEDTPRIISLSQSPLHVSARTDGGLWVLNRSSLRHYDAKGALKQSLNVFANNLVGVERNAVWIINYEQAWFVNAEGEIRGPYPWEGFGFSAGKAKALCYLTVDKPRRLQCLEPDGKTRFFSWPYPIGGKFMALSDGRLVTLAGTQQILYYEPNGTVAKVDVDNAGLTTLGEAFISVRVDDNWTDICVSNGTKRRLPVRYKNPFLASPYRYNVLAVEGDRTLVYGYDRLAVWYNGSKVENTFFVGDRSYRNDVFPKAWSPHQIKFTAQSRDGTVIISTTGPTGMAIIGLRWNP